MNKLLLLIILINFSAFSQHKIIEVNTKKYPQNGDVVFTAENRSKSNYVLLVSISDLKNVQHGIPNTNIRTIPPGISTLFILRKTTTTINRSVSIGYRYKYGYIKGCYNPKIDKDYNYMIPLGVGKATEMRFLKDVGSSIGKETPDNYTVYGFSSHKNDTVFASRGGIVSKISKNNKIEDNNSIYSANRNLVEINHEDCSYASYKTLKKFFVKEGDVVCAGDPLGILKAKSGTDEVQMIFSDYYYNVQNSSGMLAAKVKYMNVLIDVGDSFKKLTEGTYQVVHHFETVTQEMSKREIKNYKKRKSSK